VTWRPGDDELEALARTLPVGDRASDRIEHERTNVLAQAARIVQRRRSSVVPLVAGVAAAVAAAAVVVLWVIVRPGTAAPKERITALGPAHFERVRPWPDFVVRIDEGRVAIQVAKLDAGERFRAVTSDAEIEVRGTQFTVAAEQGHVTSVAVAEGRVEIRYHGEPSIFLAAGETWSPPHAAQRDVIESSPPAIAAAEPPPAKPVVTAVPAPLKPVVASEPPARSRGTTAAAPTKHGATTAHVTTTASASTTGHVTATAAGSASVPAAPPPPRPGEAEFRAGVAALRAGDAASATRSFASACAAAHGEALDEDACFWVGAAANRAGDTATARGALTRFLTAFPASARAGEASALLGWILYDAGELDAAKQRFDVAARDRVQKVKESAGRGLEAIRRKRADD
jgi:hypothetical protein